MLRRSELPIIKEGVLTLDGYSFSMIYKMIGICENPGKYYIGQDRFNEDTYLASNGKEIWMTNNKDEVIVGSPKSKEELDSILNSLLEIVNNPIRYYEIGDILYREHEDKIYYLTPVGSNPDDIVYVENHIPLSVVFKVLRPDFPTKSSKEAMIFSGRLDSMKRESLTREYLDQYIKYFGYTKVENYYVLLTFDDVVRIDTVEDGKLRTLKTTLDYLKEVMII